MRKRMEILFLFFYLILMIVFKVFWLFCYPFAVAANKEKAWKKTFNNWL